MITYEQLPLDAISAASHAAAEKHGMGALHVGSHVLLALLNEGHVTLTHPKMPCTCEPRPVDGCAEVERLRAEPTEAAVALNALLDSHWSHYCSDGVGMCVAVSWEKFCDAWDVLHPDNPASGIESLVDEVAARAVRIEPA